MCEVICPSAIEHHLKRGGSIEATVVPDFGCSLVLVHHSVVFLVVCLQCGRGGIRDDVLEFSRDGKPIIGHILISGWHT